MTDRQRMCSLSRDAMVDLLAWRRYMFVYCCNKFWRESVMTTLLARALLNLAAFIHAGRNTLVHWTTTHFSFTQLSRPLDKPSHDLEYWYRGHGHIYPRKLLHKSSFSLAITTSDRA